MSERVKILPLLIIVAMLAFSVRLVEVVSGVRDISGGAFAAAEQANADDAAMPPQETLAMTDAPDEVEAESEHESEPAAEEEAPAAQE